jgi:O-antigen ligase
MPPWEKTMQTRFSQIFYRPDMSGILNAQHIRLGMVILMSLGVGLAVIVSTYYVDNVKLLVGLMGGIAFVLLTMRWPEFGILCLVALMSGLVSLTSLPLLHLGPVSLNISDIILMLLLALVFLRATTQRGFVLFGSPLTLPLLLFIGAIFFSALTAIFIYNVNANAVLRTVRMLGLWILFLPTLLLVRDEKSLRRLLIGMLILTFILLIGILFPNRFAPLLPIEERDAATGAETYSGITRVYFAGDMILYAMIPIMVASLATIKKGNPLWRIIFLGFLLFWAYRTLFRNYWLTLLVVCILLVLFLSPQERTRLLKRMTWTVVASLLIAIVFTVTQPHQVEKIAYVISDRVGSLLKEPLKTEGSLQWRMIETYYALRQIKHHPVFGIGLANHYRPPMESEGEMYSNWTYKYIENGYLYILVMMGFVGFIPFLWLCAAYLLRILRHHHEIKEESLRAVYLGLGAAFLGMLVCNFVIPAFVFGSRLIFFPLAMAISEIILRLEHVKRPIQIQQD